MRPHPTRKALKYAAVFQALCVIALAFPQSAQVARGPDRLKEAAELNDRAAELAGRKQFVQAAKLYEQAQAMLEKSLGSQHPATVAAEQESQAFRGSLILELLDRFVTIVSLAEFRDREFDRSVAEIRELLPLAPLRDRSYEPLKEILLGVGLRTEAEIVLRTGLGTFPDSRLLRIYLAEALSEMGRSPEALSILEEAGKLPPPEGLDAEADRRQRALVLLRMGIVHSAMSRLDEALTAHLRAVEIAPDWYEGRVHLGKAYFSGNRLEEARAEFERAALQTPDDREAHLGLSEAYLALGQWEQAAAAAGSAFKPGEADSRTLYLLGTALIRMGRREEGEAHLREFAKAEARVLEVERRYLDIDSISLAAIRALRAGDGDGAIRRLIRGIASYPDSSRLYMNLAMVLSRLGQHKTAVETLESMLRRTNDRRFLIHKNLAEEYELLGDPEAARRHRRIYEETREAEFLRGSATATLTTDAAQR